MTKLGTKKSLSIQNLNPKATLTVLIWLILAWILARPLQGIGQNIYKFFGAFTYTSFQGISKTKVNAEEILRSKTLIKKQLSKISILETKVIDLESELKKHNKLKQLLNLKSRLHYKTIGANVLARSADNWHKQIIIDKGTSHNIMLGDTVFGINGIIGQIVDVKNDTSIAQLISDPSYKLGCRIARSNILGILTGKTNSVGRIEFIPIGSDVKVGDLVITSGIKTSESLPTYPPNHPIGRISKVSKEKSQVSDLYIEVRLSEDLNSVDDVLVFSPT